ncbi:MAG: C40 family peptidase [Acidobacteriota bacterium]
MYYIKHDKLKISIVFILLLLLNYCSFRSEPEKVWNIRSKIVTLTESLKGIPYRYGGFEIDGFDCSGFVYYIYDSFGINIPRTAKKQGKIKARVRFKSAKPGDILVFKIKRNRWHTGIYVNDKFFVHSPNGRGFVRREGYSKFWKKKLKYVISILDDI